MPAGRRFPDSAVVCCERGQSKRINSRALGRGDFHHGKRLDLLYGMV